MKQFTYTITAPHGIHGRPAAELVQTARGFESTLTLEKGGQSADCHRMLSLLTLCVKQGDTVTLTAQGPDEAQAIDALRVFFQNNL